MLNKLSLLLGTFLLFNICIGVYYYDVALKRYPIAELHGQVEDCSCQVSEVNDYNCDQLFDITHDLTKTSFFKFFKVNYWRECSFWNEEPLMCSGDGKSPCGICPCEDDEIPPGWREDEKNKLIQPPVERESWTSSGEFDDDDEKSSVVSIRSSNDSVFVGESSGDIWTVQDCSEELISLEKNPERYTGYGGGSAAKIWMALYKENCFTSTDGKIKDECLEERLLYRLISGLHGSTTAHICYSFFNDDGKWAPNMELFAWRLGNFPDRMINIYFTYVVLLRAVSKSASYLREYDYFTGDANESKRTQNLVKNLTDAIHQLEQCSDTFDEAQLFLEDKEPLKEQMKEKFRNISLIMDCVQCETCKVHAKLQVLGIGTALKILLGKDPLEHRQNTVTSSGECSTGSLPEHNLQRNEVSALINTLFKFSESLKVISEMRVWARRAALTSAGLAMAKFSMVVLLLAVVVRRFVRRPVIKKDNKSD